MRGVVPLRENRGMDAAARDPDDPAGEGRDLALDTPADRRASVLALVRGHPLETAAVALLGVGGLMYPFPLWLIGAAAVVASRLWDTRDKWSALAVPVAFALLGAIAVAGLTARPGLAGYARTVRIDGWDLIRDGVLAAAGYLAWRVRQGPRPPRPPREPPWRRPPQGR